MVATFMVNPNELGAALSNAYNVTYVKNEPLRFDISVELDRNYEKVAGHTETVRGFVNLQVIGNCLLVTALNRLVAIQTSVGINETFTEPMHLSIEYDEAAELGKQLEAMKISDMTSDLGDELKGGELGVLIEFSDSDYMTVRNGNAVIADLPEADQDGVADAFFQFVRDELEALETAHYMLPDLGPVAINISVLTKLNKIKPKPRFIDFLANSEHSGRNVLFKAGSTVQGILSPIHRSQVKNKNFEDLIIYT